VGGLEVVLLGDVQVDEVALQDGVCADIEDGDKHAGHQVGESKDSGDRDEWVVDRLFFVYHDAKEHEAAESSANGNAELSQEHEHLADGLNEAELHGILEDQDEGVNCRCAEALAGDSHVDISIAVDVAEETVEAVKAASDACEQAGRELVVTRGASNLFANVLKNNADCGDNSA